MKHIRPWSPVKILVAVVSILVLGWVGFGAYWYAMHRTFGAQQESNATVPVDNYLPPMSDNAWKPARQDVFIPPLPPASDGYVNPVANTAVTYNSQPIAMADQKLVLGYVDGYSTTPFNENIPAPSYYQLGMHGQNTVILAVAAPVDPGGPAMLFFEKTPNGAYIFMQKMSTYGIYGYGSLGYASAAGTAGADLGTGYALSSRITQTNTITFYEGIVGPNVVNYKGLVLEQDYLYPADLFTNYVKQSNYSGTVTVTKAASLAQGDLYLYQQPSPQEGTNVDPVHFYIRKYLLRLPSGLYTLYGVMDDFIPQTYTPATITWNDGTKNEYYFDPAAGLGGCSNPDSYVVAEQDISQKIQPAGVSASGHTIYEFKDINDPVLLYFYHYWNGLRYDTSSTESVTVSDWYKDHPVIVYKNPLGDYTLLLNEKYGMTGGCGKPVIYLYPTKPTAVSVQVGADITTSEPAYGSGWHVVAHSDGTLTTADGATYDSLFWEGTGHGNYPSITQGFVVSRADLKLAITSQLKQLGLNEKESADFLRFWLPKMPTTPYVRLTWFGTEQMDQLAPLVILPRPDTVIRIFLDFEGLEKNTSFPPQQLTSLPRKGFTVVEWGGLLKK